MPGSVSIGEAARQSGLSAKTIRYYESIGLIPAPRRAENGYRTYTPEEVRRIRFISHARALGFSLGETQEILRAAQEASSPCNHVAGVIAHKITRMDRLIAELSEWRDGLREMGSKCSEAAEEVEAGKLCPVIEAGDGSRVPKSVSALSLHVSDES